MAKNAQPIMFATRNGTIVCVSNVATKKIAPTRANILASVMLCRKISSRRLKMASQVTLFGSRPIWTRIFANLRLSVAASRMRSSMMDISPFGAGEASLPEVALSQRNKLGRPTSEVGQSRRLDCRSFTSGIRLTPAVSLRCNDPRQGPIEVTTIMDLECRTCCRSRPRPSYRWRESRRRLELNDVFGRNALHAALADEADPDNAPAG